ncbi:MAG: hypothetical protein ABI851_02070 [Saprospiraceae bacterium]
MTKSIGVGPRMAIIKENNGNKKINMKLIQLLVLAVFVQFNLSSQTSKYDSLEFIKAELKNHCTNIPFKFYDTNSSEKLDSLLNEFVIHVNSLRYTNKNNVIQLLDSINEFINSKDLFDTSILINKRFFYPLFINYKMVYYKFKQTLLYNHLTTDILLDTLIKNNETNLISDIIFNYSDSKIIDLFLSASCDKKVDFMHYYFPKNKKGYEFRTKLIEFEVNNTNQCEEVFLDYIIGMQKINSIIPNNDSIIDTYLEYFKTNFDTISNKELLDLITQRNKPKIQITPQWLIEVEQEERDKEIELQRIRQIQLDSIVTLFNNSNLSKEDQLAFETIMKSDDPLSNFSFTEQDTLIMDSLAKLEYLQRLDTTLNDNYGRYHGASYGDDGIRFDILDNNSLFNKLEQYSYNLLEDSLKTEIELNTHIPIIHLRKITQLIGDRILLGTLIPDSSQHSEINRLVDFCQQVFSLDTSEAWVDECLDLVFRLWLPFKPRLYSWVTNSNQKLRSIADNYLYLLMDENMARLLATLGSETMDQNNRQLAEIYIAPLSIIDTYKEADLSGLPPRRYCTRSWEESVRWLNEFIYPAMLKVGWLEVIK